MENDMMSDDMMNDPDRKQYLLCQEQLEFWKQRYEEEELTPEQKKHAEDKYIEFMEKSIKALERFNNRWDEFDGPLPELDDEALKLIQGKFAQTGREVTLEELKEALRDDDHLPPS